MATLEVFQIFYNQATKDQIMEGFTPLDNSLNERANWYEFWPMVKKLRQMNLDSDDWIGFFSPSFFDKNKTGFKTLLDIFQQIDSESNDALLLHADWSQIAYFKNAWEQAEYFHPGIEAIFDDFLKAIQWPKKSSQIVGHTMNTVFSNQFIAKASLWKRWLILAEQLIAIIDQPSHRLFASLNQPMYYRMHRAHAFVFLQERLINLILQNPKTKATSCILDPTMVNTHLFDQTDEARALLKECNQLKQNFMHRQDKSEWQAYQSIRKQIKLHPITVAPNHEIALMHDYFLTNQDDQVEMMGQWLGPNFPLDFRIQKILGVSRFNRGDVDGAKPLLEQVMTLAPDDDEARAVLEKMVQTQAKS